MIYIYRTQLGHFYSSTIGPAGQQLRDRSLISWSVSADMIAELNPVRGAWEPRLRGGGRERFIYVGAPGESRYLATWQNPLLDPRANPEKDILRITCGIVPGAAYPETYEYRVDRYDSEQMEWFETTRIERRV